MEEVIGSIPLGSTIFLQRNAAILAFCAAKQVPTAPSLRAVRRNPVGATTPDFARPWVTLLCS
jgi:hypothetical protein